MINIISNYFISIVAIFILFIILKILLFPLKIIKKLVYNGIVGSLMLLIFNLVAASYGYEIEINLVSSILVGFFGVFGILVLLV